ncbi:MAG: hypothetical protein J6Q89_07805 [Clostridia bacterium]|nr:hypothetical protein [Clostridia bacterium]
MKKLLLIILALTMCISMCACEYEWEKIEKTLPETAWTNANTYSMNYRAYDFQNDGHLYIDEYSRWSGKEKLLRSYYCDYSVATYDDGTHISIILVAQKTAEDTDYKPLSGPIDETRKITLIATYEDECLKLFYKEVELDRLYSYSLR